jgi:hypothetical protein
MPSRIIIRIELTPGAKSRLKGICEKTGMTQVAVLSRMVEWFAGQSEVIQAAVLGHYPAEVQAEVAKLILRRMASEDRRE